MGILWHKSEIITVIGRKSKIIAGSIGKFLYNVYMSKKTGKYLIFGIVIVAAILVAYNERTQSKVTEVKEKTAEIKKIDIPGLANELLTPNPQPTSSLTQEWKELGSGIALRRS